MDEDELQSCGFCGYTMEQLDKCEACGTTYCEYCGVQGHHLCSNCIDEYEQEEE